MLFGPGDFEVVFQGLDFLYAVCHRTFTSAKLRLQSFNLRVTGSYRFSKLNSQRCECNITKYVFRAHFVGASLFGGLGLNGRWLLLCTRLQS